MTEAVLSVRGLVKRFGRAVALDGVDLEARAGEIVVVLGPTGAGKTTLLRTIAGLETPDAGSIRLAGADAASLGPAERDVALVFQNFSLYPRWTVRRNLEFPLRAPGRGLTEAEIGERVRRAAELLRIERLLDRDARRLSGGEMQRVAIGRAIVRRPRLFLMDEPLTNLDAKLRESLRVEIATLSRSLGAPLVYVTHDAAEALSMADRIVVLGEGRVLQEGSPQEVYRAPASPVAARQIGQPPMNVLRARRAGDRWLAADGTPLARASTGAPDHALLGIRAEHVEPEGGDAAAVVEVVEDLGPRRILVVRFAGETLRLLVHRGFAARPGDTIRPRLAPDRVVVWTD